MNEVRTQAWGVLLSSCCVLPAPVLMKYQAAVVVFQNYVIRVPEWLHYFPPSMQAWWFFHMLVGEIPHESKLRDTKLLVQEMCKNAGIFFPVQILFFIIFHDFPILTHRKDNSKHMEQRWVHVVMERVDLHATCNNTVDYDTCVLFNRSLLGHSSPCCRNVFP